METNKNANETNGQENQKPGENKRNHKRAVLIAVSGFTIYALHVMISKGVGEFISGFFGMDLIYFANLLMTVFVLIGWYLVYRYMGKLL